MSVIDYSAFPHEDEVVVLPGEVAHLEGIHDLGHGLVSLQLKAADAPCLIPRPKVANHLPGV